MKKRMNITKHLLTCLVLSIGLEGICAGAETLRTVAFSGNAAPGTGVDFLSLSSPPTLNNNGQVAFAGTLVGPDVNDDNWSGAWSEGSGSLKLLARSGQVAPGTDAKFLGLGAPLLNDSGQTVFRASLADSSVNRSNDRGIWSDGSGSLALVAREGDIAPGTNQRFSRFGEVAFNNEGEVAYPGLLIPLSGKGNNPLGIWSVRGGTHSAVAYPNDLSPNGEVFTRVGVTGINESGHIAFTGSTSQNRRINSIWSDRSGLLKRIVSTSDGAFGTDGLFSSFDHPVLNAADQIAFAATASRGINGIWSEGGGKFDLVARNGDRASGTNETFSSFGSPSFNGAGQTAFYANLNGPVANSRNAEGIWSERNGSLGLVVRGGTIAPGTNAEFNGFRGVVDLNIRGQTAFYGYLSGAEVDESNFYGIWAQDVSGSLRLIARAGDLIDVENGPGTDFRTISYLDFGFVLTSGNEDGMPSGFNEMGQLAFSATFTDGTSGIFVSNLVAVPEPGSLVLLALAGLTMWRRVLRR